MKKYIPSIVGAAITFGALLIPQGAHAVSSAHDAANAAVSPSLLLIIAIILVAAKFFHLIEKVKQPPVVGELLAGIVLGNLGLLGIHLFDSVLIDPAVEFIAELGVILLLFQIGLESNVQELTKVGFKSLAVAIIGAVVPFVLGAYVLGPIFFPENELITNLFIGATLATTSVGIASATFKSLGKLKTQAAKIVLGAAVIDDILGLILLAVVSGIATGGAMSLGMIGMTFVQSFAFLFISIALGQYLAPGISNAFARINTGVGTKLTISIGFGLIYAALAQKFRLEPIIGAFAAGLVLDAVHFSKFEDPTIVTDIRGAMAEASSATKAKVTRVLKKHSDHSIDEVISPLVLFMAPIFFVVTGMSVNIASLLSLETLMYASILSLFAIVAKLISGVFLKKNIRWIVGMAMVPRGEVGLIFASLGQNLGVFSDQMFSIAILTVLITTIVGPFMLTTALEKSEAE